MASKKHLEKSKLIEGLPPEAICPSCKQRPAVPPTLCPFHEVIPPTSGDGMCRCCLECRNRCFDEI